MPESGHKLFGVTWDHRSTGRPRRDHPGRSLSLALGALAAVAVPLQASAAPAPAGITRASGPSSSMIVRAAAGREPAAEAAVSAAGGRVGRRLALINGFAASVPRAALPELRADSDIATLTPNASGHLMDVSNYDPTTDLGSMASTTAKYGAQKFWASGFTGRGVDVALIDSGVAPVDGLTAPGKVINGPDLSVESQNPAQTYLDSFGHGTHMAGIIAGRDNAATGPYPGDSSHFLGMAPDARIVSVKVADGSGRTTMVQMLAAIDWVVQHRTDNGMNIRVLNLSFGTDSQLPYTSDPLAIAAEAAWKRGIFVTASAGNSGLLAHPHGLADPAYDPTIMAVGASESVGDQVGQDVVPAFSSFAVSNHSRRPNLVAPGTHMQSLRAPGSYVDRTYAGTGGITPRFFRGSGTSQAAAAVSGAAALILSEHPQATPDQVRALLTGTATRLAATSSNAQGSGVLNLNAALGAALPRSGQLDEVPPANGSADKLPGVDANGGGAREATGNGGSTHSESAGSSWSGSSWSGSSWSGGSWVGSSWSGSSWSGGTWSGSSWSGSSWSGSSWSGSSWSGSSWSGSSWSGSSWSDALWAATDWS